jgi:hypothetical protein
LLRWRARRVSRRLRGGIVLCRVEKMYTSLLSAGWVVLVYKPDVLLSNYPRAYCLYTMGKCRTFMFRVVKISPCCRHTAPLTGDCCSALASLTAAVQNLPGRAHVKARKLLAPDLIITFVPASCPRPRILFPARQVCIRMRSCLHLHELPLHFPPSSWTDVICHGRL